MVLAVLEAHASVRLGQHDVYLNVAGGLRIAEPAADLAVAAALVSSLTGRKLPSDMAIFGEVSLSGSVRPVSHAGQRCKEAMKLGFTRAAVPTAAGADEPETALHLRRIGHISELVAWIAGETSDGRTRVAPART
jgi:DNA repair protein RadA/Sms